jgi:hypothetical protein
MLIFLIELKDRTVISQGNHMSEAYSHNSHTVFNASKKITRSLFHYSRLE